MKILLIGEYSRVHWTLAQGLRILGHEVTVLSNGDFWKDYPRDINLSRTYTKWGGLRYIARLMHLLPHLKGYDIVQLINPMFLELKAERILPVYRYLRRHNGKIVLGAFGMDYYWVKTCVEEKPLRYSDFNIGTELRTNSDALRERADWLNTPKGRLNQLIAEDCDGIVAGLYEYWVCYSKPFPTKTQFIPYPIEVTPHSTIQQLKNSLTPLRVFIGINRNRSEYKGTDIMLKAAQEVAHRHPDNIILQIAENVPYEQYTRLMEGADCLLDQLYSYTPSMNPLQAMQQGIVCIGGGEPENYDILGETELRPIINVGPDYDSVVEALEWLIAHRDQLPNLKWQSREYIKRHHDHLKVARKYEQFYQQIIKKKQ